jgi:hypothetical protein
MGMNLIKIIEESWGWLGIKPDEIVGENDFGNLIIRDVLGKYWRLCPEDLYCKVIAENREQLDALSKSQEFLADWYMSSLASEAKEKYGILEGGRKYHLAIPGTLGGEYRINNIRTISQTEQIRFCGDLAHQISELPDGAKIELKITD